MNSAKTLQPQRESQTMKVSGIESLQRVAKQPLPERSAVTTLQEKRPGVITMPAKSLAPKPKPPKRKELKRPNPTPQQTPSHSARTSMIDPSVPGRRGSLAVGFSVKPRSNESELSGRYAWAEDGDKKEDLKRLHTTQSVSMLSSTVAEGNSKVHEHAQAVERVWWSGWFDFLPVALISWLLAFALFILPFLLNFWFVHRAEGHSAVQRIAGHTFRTLKGDFLSGFSHQNLQAELDGARAEHAGFGSSAEGRECVEYWTSVFQNELLSSHNNASQPDVVHTVLSRLFGANWWPASTRLEALSHETSLIAFVGKIGGCAAENVMLGRIACRARDDSTLRLKFAGASDFAERLRELVTYFQVLDELTKHAVTDAPFAREIVDRLAERFDEQGLHTRGLFSMNATNEYGRDRDEYDTTKAGVEELLGAIKERRVDPLTLEAMLELHVLHGALRATTTDLRLVGVTLAAAVQGRGGWASVSADAELKLSAPLGREWVDTFLAWRGVWLSDSQPPHRLGQRLSSVLIPSVSCAAPLSTAAADFLLPHMLAALIDLSYQGWAGGPGLFSSDGTSAEATAAWGDVLYLSVPWRLPERGDVTRMAEALHTVFRPTGWSLFSYVATEDFALVSAMSLLAACLLAATALESIMSLIVLPLLQKEAADSAAWMTEMLYSLFVMVALYAQSPWGIPFMIVGTWRAGIPECLSGFLCALDPLAPNTMLERMHLFVRAVSMGLHHTTTAFVVCAISVGYSTLNRDILAVCLPMAYLHLAAPLRYQSQSGYLLLVVLLEVWWQFEAFYFLSNAHPLHEWIALWIMLAAHYCIILADGLDALRDLVSWLGRCGGGSRASTASSDADEV